MPDSVIAIICTVVAIVIGEVVTRHYRKKDKFYEKVREYRGQHRE